MNRREQLMDWVKGRHRGQFVKGTTLPYFEHVIQVAELAGPVASLTFEIGLCHDLLEKTKTGVAELAQILIRFGYDQSQAEHISGCVTELTRQFTKRAYPELHKLQRKVWEDARLSHISPDAQTVKYADLLYNAEWMMAHDREQAMDYLSRKLDLLAAMINGDARLRWQVTGKLQALYEKAP